MRESAPNEELKNVGSIRESYDLFEVLKFQDGIRKCAIGIVLLMGSNLPNEVH